MGRDHQSERIRDHGRVLQGVCEGEGRMISADELNIIVNSYPEVPVIRIENDTMERVGETPRYILHREDGDYTVKGLGWGHGHLFVITEEKGTIGITYEHETIGEQEDDEQICECGQMTLDAWGVAEEVVS